MIKFLAAAPFYFHSETASRHFKRFLHHFVIIIVIIIIIIIIMKSIKMTNAN